MSKWQKEPPTYREWRDANNHGCWWVKFMLTPETTDKDEEGHLVTWPEAWYTEVVTIGCSYKNGFTHIMQEIQGEEPDYSGITLHARGHILKDFDLDDTNLTDKFYWQSVVPPLDDVKDERPKV